MFRAPNPFDTRVGHAAQRLASGGGSCSTCTSCCSCVVSLVGVSILSTRMVAKAVPAPLIDEVAGPDEVIDDQATVRRRRLWRLVMAALLPTGSLLGSLGLVLGAGNAGYAGPLGLLSLVLLISAFCFVVRSDGRLVWKLLLLLLVVLPALMVGEMFVWINSLR